MLPCMYQSCSIHDPNLIFEGLVSKSEIQRETHETAEHAEWPETRVFPRPKEDEGAGRETGSRGTGTLLLLRR